MVKRICLSDAGLRYHEVLGGEDLGDGLDTYTPPSSRGLDVSNWYTDTDTCRARIGDSLDEVELF